MGSPQIATFETIDLNGLESNAWQSRVATLKQTQGICRIFFGPTNEDPAKGILVAQWASAPSASSDVIPLEFSGDSLGAALEAPTIEIFTAYGAETGFFSQTEQFLAKVGADPPKKGYFGSAAGKNTAGDLVKMVIGWESQEAHAEAKSAPGSSIVANIELIRSGRQSVDVFHVRLEEQ